MGGGGGGGGLATFNPCLFSLNNSKMVKGVTMPFHFIRDIRVKFGIPILPQSPDIGQNSDVDTFDFTISGQSFTKQNCCNSRSNHDINMKLGSVTKLDNRNTAMPNKIDNDVMLTTCDVNDLFLIYR